MTTVRAFMRGAGLVAAVLLVSACSVLPTPTPTTQYRLPGTPAAANPGATRLPWSLRLGLPQTTAMLDGTRILVLPDGDQVSNYAGARWSDPPGSLVQARLVQAFRIDGRVASVSTEESNAHAEFELDSSLRAFQSEYRDGKPFAVIGLDVNVVDASTRRVVATRSFDVAAPAADVKLPAVVTAFGQAADALGAQLVPWVVESGSLARKQ
jgi:cholesterol transport system auxiliary component